MFVFGAVKIVIWPLSVESCGSLMKEPFKKSSVISENHLFEFEPITFLPYRDEANPDLDFELN